MTSSTEFTKRQSITEKPSLKFTRVKKMSTVRLAFALEGYKNDDYLRRSMALIAPTIGSDLIETVPSKGWSHMNTKVITLCLIFYGFNLKNHSKSIKNELIFN
jgi:hypothetical protein